MDTLLTHLRILVRYLGVLNPKVDSSPDPDIFLVVITVRDYRNNLLFTDTPVVLSSLNVILKEMIATLLIPGIVVVDFDGTRQKTVQETKNKAEIAYRRVVTYQKPYEFKNLKPFERLIIHQYLATKQGIQTKSYGERNERTLVINKSPLS